MSRPASSGFKPTRKLTRGEKLKIDSGEVVIYLENYGVVSMKCLRADGKLDCMSKSRIVDYAREDESKQTIPNCGV